MPSWTQAIFCSCSLTMQFRPTIDEIRHRGRCQPYSWVYIFSIRRALCVGVWVLFFFNLNLFLLLCGGGGMKTKHLSIQRTVNVIVKCTKNYYEIYFSNSMMPRTVSGDSESIRHHWPTHTGTWSSSPNNVISSLLLVVHFNTSP